MPSPQHHGLALGVSLAGLARPWQPAGEIQGDARPATPGHSETGLSPKRLDRRLPGRQEGKTLWESRCVGGKYAKEHHGPRPSFCPPRPCVTLTARKISQS